MKLFVWDFHGTLEKGNDDAVWEINNHVLATHGYKERFTKEECYKLAGIKWYLYFEFLLPHQSHYTHLKLQKDCFEFSNSHPEIISQYIELTDNALEILNKIQQTHDQILISNTKPDSLSMFMNLVNIVEYFPNNKYFATDAHSHNNSKELVLKNYLRTQQVYDQIITIGDSLGDIELGKSVNALTIQYTHSFRKFVNHQADIKINNLRDILQYI